MGIWHILSLTLQTDRVTVDTFVTGVRDQIRARTRLEIGDNATSFAVSTITDGIANRFDLGVAAVDATTLAVTVNNVVISSNQYSVIADEGILVLTNAPSAGANLTATGTAYQFFTDAELDVYLDSALLKHTHDASTSYASIDVKGFKQFSHVPVTLATLPPVEYHLVALLAGIEALWVLEADAAYDIDVSTALGTSLPRSERFRNIQTRIDQLQARYDAMAQQLNVGLSRVEISKLRRVSQTTGRLVPLYREREYDDNAVPPRLLPRIDAPGQPVPDLVPSTDLTLTAVGGNAFSQQITVPLNLAGTTVTARLVVGGYIPNATDLALSGYAGSQPYYASYVDMPVVVNTTGLTSAVTVSLTGAVTQTLPQAATWHLAVTDAQGIVTIPYSGTFLTERTG